MSSARTRDRQRRRPQRRRASLRAVSCRSALVLSLAVLVVAGCTTSPRRSWRKTVRNKTEQVDRIAAQLDHPSPPVIEQVAFAQAPLTAQTVDMSEIIYLDRALGEIIEQGLCHSDVLRDIGGVVLRSPETIRTNLSDSLQQTDPQFGMESALSAFDAQLTASTIFSNNDRIFNNAFFAGGTTTFQQDLHEYQIELSKRTATGSTLAIRSLTEYDANNAPANTFRSSFDSLIEGEVRQPLLQGGGLEFNRIAGPGSTPGLYNGVLIARTNFDINHADFQLALRDFISNIENAYWDLYLAYRELDAKKKAMEQALVLWNEAKSQASGEIVNKAQEALARQQYFRLKSDVDDALSGRILNGTQTRNGSTGGTLQAATGILAAERRLRLMIGLPANDGTLIRPSDEPPMVRIPFDWDICLEEALSQRPELQRQNAVVKKREMELLAAKNFLNPRLDAVGRYRYRGFGDDFLGGGSQAAPNPASSLGNLVQGDTQEWSLGLELSMPVGFRQAHAAVTHAQLAISRARTIQSEQQREIVSNLSGAFADADRAQQQVENKLSQYLAAKEYFTALTVQKEEQGVSVPADRLIDAMDRVVRAEVEFFRSRSEYAVALKNIHHEKGTILQYKDLRVAESYTDVANAVIPPSLAEPTDAQSTDDSPPNSDDEIATETAEQSETPEIPLEETDFVDIPRDLTIELPLLMSEALDINPSDPETVVSNQAEATTPEPVIELEQAPLPPVTPETQPVIASDASESASDAVATEQPATPTVRSDNAVESAESSTDPAQKPAPNRDPEIVWDLSAPSINADVADPESKPQGLETPAEPVSSEAFELIEFELPAAPPRTSEKPTVAPANLHPPAPVTEQRLTKAPEQLSAATITPGINQAVGQAADTPQASITPKTEAVPAFAVDLTLDSNPSAGKREGLTHQAPPKPRPAEPKPAFFLDLTPTAP